MSFCIYLCFSQENEKDSGSGTELNTSSEEMNTESILTPPGLTVSGKTSLEQTHFKGQSFILLHQLHKIILQLVHDSGWCETQVRTVCL